MLFRVAIAAVMFLSAAWQTQPATFRLRGTVESSHGAAVAMAAVRLTTSPSHFISQLTGAQGQFSFAVAVPGPYTLSVATRQGIQTFTVSKPDAHLRFRMAKPKGRRPPALSVPTVSLNDLRASVRAKKNFIAAQNALQHADMKRAWQLANKAIAQAPGWSRPWELRGAIDFALRNYAAARSDLDAALAKNPSNAEALTLRGRLAFVLKDNDASKRYLESALQLPPVTWAAYLDLANLDLRLHQYAETQQLAEKALQAVPPSPPAAYFLIAESHYYRRQYREAKWNLEVYLAMLPDTPANARGRASAERNLHYLASHKLTH